MCDTLTGCTLPDGHGGSVHRLGTTNGQTIAVAMPDFVLARDVTVGQRLTRHHDRVTATVTHASSGAGVRALVFSDGHGGTYDLDTPFRKEQP